MTNTITWKAPETFDPEAPGLRLPPLEGVEHTLLYDPLPSRCEPEYGGDGRYESLRHGTYSHHQKIVLFEDRFIVYWTQHSRDENGPGQRMLAKVGTFNADRTDIDWGGDETLFEIAPAPVPVRRKHFEHDPNLIYETYAQGSLKLINGRLYMIGALSACHGWTDDVQYHGCPGKPLPPERWFDAPDHENGVCFDIWWDLGCDFVQEWRMEDGELMAASPLYKRSEPVTQVEVAVGRLKYVIPVIEPYASAIPFDQAPERMRDDVLTGVPEKFERMPKYAPGTWRLTADGTSGLAHHTEFRRPDGSWVAIRDNLCNPGYYYAAEKARYADDYPPAVRTNLFGHAMPVAGELPDGRPWIVCNNQSRHDMYLTLSEDGRTFDQTWLLLHNARGNTDGGMHKGGGPQYFQAITVGGNIWVVYSIAKEQVGVSRIPLAALPKPKNIKPRLNRTPVQHLWAGGKPDPANPNTGFSKLDSVDCYGRWQGVYTGSAPVDGIVLVGPNGREGRRSVFRHQPSVFTYDEHGYEIVRPDGEPVRAARFTPDIPGPWHYVWLAGERVVDEGDFICSSGDKPGYVEISRHDPRYFVFTNGEPYVPIGLNLCLPEFFALSTGEEFKTGSQRGTLGARQYERWFRELATNGGNFARLWLGHSYFQAESEVAGELDLLRFSALDRVVEFACQYGIRLKLCLEHFRCFGDGAFPSRVLRHPQNGRAPRDMDEWFQSPDWQGLWRNKLEALLARYGDDPVVMAWELWNEINCCLTSGFNVQEEWTRRLLREIKAAAPRNLVTNSLGSFDHDGAQAQQDAFKMPEMDFQQVHRYLDQGAPLEICRTDTVALSVDAVQRSRAVDRPVLLAETGAVNDCHSGPFRYYGADHDGLVFHDTTYAAFFAGAAGSGHIWHWDRYVEQKNLWPGFRALAEALSGIAVDRERFETLFLSRDPYWCLGLRGRTVALLWLRNRADRWDHVLRDDCMPPRIDDARIELSVFAGTVVRAELFRPWPQDAVGLAVIDGTRLILPSFQHGLICRLHLDQVPANEEREA